MENNKQIQKAGDGSQQVQMINPTIVMGIDEKRTREIFSEMFAIERQNYTQEAIAIAQVRVDKLENALIERISELEGAAEAFGDPKFQFLLRDAQKVAASTERENDYELLSELLVCHIQKGDNRKTRSSVGMAINIVDNIDNDALCALTVCHAINTYIPTVGSCKEGMNILNILFSKLMYEKLPTDNTWLEHLDILGAIRITPFFGKQNIPDIYQNSLMGYRCVGIKKGSADYETALKKLTAVNLNSSFLGANELLDGYVRLPIPNKESINELQILDNFDIRKVNEAEIICLNEIWELYSRDSALQEEVNRNFTSMWDSFDALRNVRVWWNKIPGSFSITPVGITLAHTNAKRCDKDIPDLI